MNNDQVFGYSQINSRRKFKSVLKERTIYFHDLS